MFWKRWFNKDPEELNPLPIFNSRVKHPLKPEEYLKIAQDRANQMQETSTISDNFLEITLPPLSIISFWGDVHFGHPMFDASRFLAEFNEIKYHKRSYIVFLGDFLDGIFFGGESQSEQSASLNEQRLFLNSLFDSLRGKALLAVSGEHDSKWASRSGADPYIEFSERTSAPYIRGIAEVLIHCGRVDYHMVNSHRARGFSMYNSVHQNMRMSRFGIQDADIYASAHTHRKGVSQEGIRLFNRANVVTHISVGGYKSGDVYGDRSGFVPQKAEQMYGVSIRLHGDHKKIDTTYDILEAHQQWR